MLGCAGIVLHPQWGKGAYPVTLFTDAPHEVLLAALGRVEAQWDEPQPADAAVRDTIAALCRFLLAVWGHLCEDIVMKCLIGAVCWQGGAGEGVAEGAGGCC